MKNTRKYDFSGWVTKNDIQCNDGLTIKRNAFSKNHKTKVPLVWNHRRDDPENIIGTIELENKDKGVYGYGTFIDTPKAAYAKSAVNQKAIVAMSIAASNIERNGNDIIGGDIFEVSLVTKGANPGAFIDEVISHSIDEEDYSCIYLPYEIETYIEHSSKEEKMEEKLTEEQEAKNTKTEEKQLDPSKLTEEDIDRIIDSLNEEQAMLFNLLSMDYEKISKDSGEEGEGEEVKQNIFSSDNVLEHGVDTNEILDLLKKGRVTRLTDAVIEHGIESVDLLFTEAKMVDSEPKQSYPELKTADMVLSGVTKSPFSKIKNRYLSNLGTDELVTKGYIRGDEKQPYNIKKILSRETSPKTIYIKQHMDRDDILDIKDFDVVRFIKQDMETRFKIDLARFILVGDNRKDEDPDKVDEDKLRPIFSDSDVYVTKYEIENSRGTSHILDGLQEKVMEFFLKYKGSGNPTLFINRKDFNLMRMKRFEGQNNFYVLSGTMKLPKESDLADFLEIGHVTVTDLIPEGYSILVNLSDYYLGNDTGSDKVNFENFDIDRNQYKYLLETRLSGALVTPDSAAVFKLYSEASKPNKSEPTREKNDIKPASQYVNS